MFYISFLNYSTKKIVLLNWKL